MISKQPISTKQPQANWPIHQLPGLKESDAEKLEHHGIETTRQLLQKTQQPADLETLAAQLQVHLPRLKKWRAMADLAQIPSVGCKYCGLLPHSGIGSRQQLAKIPVHRLHQQVLRFYVSNMQRRDLCPEVSRVATWIAQAQRFPHP
ncbi:DUF4332 domain-containing protein [Candidatus Synechococcus calcipolaris G9]|uniref:DUF4332 domain-containing protein n=1 Tax=Candidatus Synechococcus calcipolaris G9 TaxID=1497997 RepID=A0ABT6F3H0_9SYNE|nr:DUF4332 domain-containing protein [Candidatus Synechococcus calcipolaris]MDG2992393.1 DUF4332 domain-containing protein [Candidatus Synechococcus calcipolaris G9]